MAWIPVYPMVCAIRNFKKECVPYHFVLQVATHKCWREVYSNAFSLSCCDISHYTAEFSMLFCLSSLHFILSLPSTSYSQPEGGKLCLGKSPLGRKCSGSSLELKDRHMCECVYKYICVWAYMCIYFNT